MNNSDIFQTTLSEKQLASSAAEKFGADFGKVQSDLQELSAITDEFEAALKNSDGDVQSLQSADETADGIIGRLRGTIAELEQLESAPLSNEQSNQVAQAKNNAQALLNRAQAGKDTVAAQLALLQQFNGKHSPTDEALRDLHPKTVSFIDKYQQPQPLPTATEDMITIESLAVQLREQAPAVDELKRLADQLSQLAKPRQEATRLADQLHSTQTALEVG